MLWVKAITLETWLYNWLQCIVAYFLNIGVVVFGGPIYIITGLLWVNCILQVQFFVMSQRIITASMTAAVFMPSRGMNISLKWRFRTEARRRMPTATSQGRWEKVTWIWKTQQNSSVCLPICAKKSGIHTDFAPTIFFFMYKQQNVKYPQTTVLSLVRCHCTFCSRHWKHLTRGCCPRRSFSMP